MQPLVCSATIRMIILGRDGLILAECFVADKGFDLIVAERQSAFGAVLLLCISCGLPALAFHIHLEDGGMVYQPVDGSERHCEIR
jgi:hypothetical protein